MAQRCDICGKSPMYGHSVSHSKHAVNRRFLPNITKRTIVYQGRKQRLNVCTKCLRTVNRAETQAA
ncbi:MAG: 50S ribosomal protein L28 [Chloroflexi bacterium]|nr:50S ribosomal protein L28 [Chloroflexota bacterium]